MFHAGEDYGFSPPYKATPERLRKVLTLIETPVVCAHWGSLLMVDDVLKYLCDIDNCYFDTSFGYGTMPKARALSILEKKDINKITIYRADNYVELDYATRRNLEITETLRDKNKKPATKSLFPVKFRKQKSSMRKSIIRLLKQRN